MSIPPPPENCNIYTPEPLAKAMARALGGRPQDKWLEPCVGQGALTHALREMGVAKNQITAIDLDPSNSPNDSLAKTLRGIEFLGWSLETPLRFDKIIANPPYINLDRLDPQIRQSALRVKGIDGRTIGEGSNCWVAFLCASLRLLKPNGNLGFLLPAAWDYANYAASIRNLLPKQFESFEIHRSRDPLFKSVRDGCVVIVGRGYKGTHYETRRFEYKSSDDFIGMLAHEQPQPYHPHIVTSYEKSGVILNDENSCILNEVMEIRLGGVTGDSKYFLMNERRRMELRLPIDCLRPVLSKSRHLISGKMTNKQWGGLRDRGERIWLFDPPPRTLKHPTVIAYLKLPPESGGCDRERTKIEERDLWYRTVLPDHIDGFISGMSKLGPWIAFSAMPRLTATNTLYTVRFRDQLTNDQKAAWALSLIASHWRGTMHKTARIYPEGLHKYEPSDLLNLKVRKIPNNVHGGVAAYAEAIRLLLGGSAEECQKFAKDWLEEKGVD
jgi:hypothetical protein